MTSWEDQVVECTPTDDTIRTIRAGLRAFEESVQEHGPSDDWDRAVIATVIRAFADQGRPFSINDCREHLPEVRTALISRGFIAAQRDGLIEWHGRVTPSNLESTKAASVKVYVPVLDETRERTLPPAPARKERPAAAAVDDAPALFDLVPS